MLHRRHPPKAMRASAWAIAPMRRLARIVIVALALAAGARATQAQVIGIYEDAAGSDNCIQARMGMPITFYIRFVPGGGAPGFTGVEFRVAGLVANPPWFINIIPVPATDVCWTGCDPFGPGVLMAFPSCITTPVNLLTIQGFVVGTMPEMEWTVVGADPPSNPQFGCPLVYLCDLPNFTRLCVSGGQAFVNRPGECPVAVESWTWSRVRSLYAAP